jgi:hypothetical protein
VTVGSARWCAAVVVATSPARHDDGWQGRGRFEMDTNEGSWARAMLHSAAGMSSTLPLGWVLLAYALRRSRLVQRWQAILFSTFLPVLLLLPDRWGGAGGLLTLVAFLVLAPLVSGVRPRKRGFQGRL